VTPMDVQVEYVAENLDEDVADTRLAEGRVAVGPHDAHRLHIEGRVIEGVQRTLRCRHAVGKERRQASSRAAWPQLPDFPGNSGFSVASNST
jgi:hypothetical protein